MVGQEYKNILKELRQYQGTEYYNLLKSLLETRLGDIVQTWLDEKDYIEAARLQGAAKEIRKLLDSFYPRIIERA